MKTILSLSAVAAMLYCFMHLAGCGKDEGGAPAAGKTAPAPIDYAPIDAKVAAAKTGDDFTNLIMECGKLELEAATSGVELARDATHQDHCKVRPALARAEMAIAESTPDKMSSHCLSGVMGLETLIEEKVAAEKASELLPKVKAACGM